MLRLVRVESQRIVELRKPVAKADEKSVVDGYPNRVRSRCDGGCLVPHRLATRFVSHQPILS